MERLTKKELRALLEFIKECYLICDLETFAQRVVSRLSKIVSSEIISHNGSRVSFRCDSHLDARPRAAPRFCFQNTYGRAAGKSHLGLQSKFYPRMEVKYGIVPRFIKQVAVNCKAKNWAIHDKPLLKL